MNNERLITPEEFNRNIKQWSQRVRNKMVTGAPRSDKESGRHLKDGISYQTKESYGVVWKTAFKFPKQGIYVHYGVGRGWTRSGGSVIRGKSDRYAGYRKKDYTINSNANAKGRRATDWFNSVVKANIGELADYTQEYYGDDAQRKLLQEIDKMIIKNNK